MYYICKHLYFSCENVDIYENVNIRSMEPVLWKYRGRHSGLAKPKVQMSEGIQNVVFNLMNTSVVWVLQHAEATELSLPKA